MKHLTTLASLVSYRSQITLKVVAQSLVDSLEGPLATLTDDATTDTTCDSTQLFNFLQDELEEKLFRGYSKKAPSDPLSSTTSLMYLIGKVVATQKASRMREEGYEVDEEVLESEAAAINAFPVWRMSLLYWTKHCLIQTDEVEKFSQRLIELGAIEDQPSIVSCMGQS